MANAGRKRREHWIVFLDGRFLARRATRLAAQRLVDRPWKRGAASVLNDYSEERWERRVSSWFQMQKPKDRKAQAELKLKQKRPAPPPQSPEKEA